MLDSSLGLASHTSNTRFAIFFVVRVTTFHGESTRVFYSDSEAKAQPGQDQINQCLKTIVPQY